MSVSLTITRDDLTPALAKALETPQLQARASLAAAMVVQSMTQQAFRDPSMRPAPWAAHSKRHAARRLKKETSLTRGKKPATVQLLIDTGALSHSIYARQEGLTAVVGSPTIYAATHQFGSRNGHIPARPFFPFIGPPESSRLTPLAEVKVRNALETIVETELRRLL